jgi:hypothetical protein
MNNLERRLQRVEEQRKPPEDDKITVRFAYLRKLPYDYVGPRHEVLLRGFPTESAKTDCIIQEVPGVGTELTLEFPKVPGRRTMLVRLVESDGDGHTKPYWPEGHPGANPVPPAGEP